MLLYFMLGCGDQPSTENAPVEAPKEDVVQKSAQQETTEKTTSNKETPKKDTWRKKDENSDPQYMSNRYKEQANNLVQALEGDKPAYEILKMSEELTRTGLSFIPRIIINNPECKEYLEAVRKVAPQLKDLPIEEIESGYHADGKLPKTPSPKCYHGKDLIVHPATVSALAKAGLSTPESRQKAKNEIVEVLSHLSAVDIK